MGLFTLPARIATGTFVLSSLLLATGVSSAEEAKAPPAAVKPLLTEDIVGIAGKEALMLTVEYPPGGSSEAHRHNADVFVYVLEGSIIMQVDGQPAVTLKPGQTFHEKPTDIHRQSANASKSEPAKFLVFIVKDKGKPVTAPLPKAP